MKSVSIIGIGRVGGALALGLSAENYRIDCLFAKNPARAESISAHIDPPPFVGRLSEADEISSDIIFITTQDREIENAVKALKDKKIAPAAAVFHTSGSLSSEILAELNGENRRLGSIHPLVSISEPFLGVKRMRGAYFCLEGHEKAVTVAEEIVGDLGGRSFSIGTEFKTLYHASAVTACGHLVALIDVSMEMLEKCGLDPAVAKEILMPLIESTVENLSEQKNSEALTGTFARGDLETLRKHIESLCAYSSDEILEIYLLLGARSLKLAGQQGVAPDRLEKMSAELSLAKNKSRC
jgi:predicted short-subunit dehydrogenase-like oxidoreductase (DUF2520 family)